MSVRRVSPREALELMRSEGYVYVDVRSIPEFERGHPEGAYNVPLAHMVGGSMQPNPHFVTVIQARFPTDARLVLGCRTGVRSLHAATLLHSLGYGEVVDQRAGWSGTRAEPGWTAEGLPAATEPVADRTWQALADGIGE